MVVVRGLIATALWITLVIALWPHIARRFPNHDHLVFVAAVLFFALPLLGWAGLLQANRSPWTPASAAPSAAVCDQMVAQAPQGAVYYLNDPCIWVAWDHRDDAGGVYIQTSQGWIECQQLAEDVALGILEAPATPPCQPPTPATLGTAGPESQLLPAAKGSP